MCFLTLVRQCNDLRHSPSAPLLPDPEPLLSPSPEPQTQPADVTVSEPEPGCVRAEHNSAFCEEFLETLSRVSEARCLVSDSDGWGLELAAGWAPAKVR